MLSTIGVCRNEDGKYSVDLRFSENVKTTTAVKQIVTIEQQGVSLGCSLVASSKGVYALCSTLSATTQLDVGVASGLVSTSAGAKHVTALDGKATGTISFVPASFKTSDMCYGGRVPL